MIKKLLNIFYSIVILTFINTNTNILYAKDVYLGGNSIGIEMNKNGVIVSGTYDIVIDNKIYNPSIDSNIKVSPSILHFIIFAS